MLLVDGCVYRKQKLHFCTIHVLKRRNTNTKRNIFMAKVITHFLMTILAQDTKTRGREVSHTIDLQIHNLSLR